MDEILEKGVSVSRSSTDREEDSIEQGDVSIMGNYRKWSPVSKSST